MTMIDSLTNELEGKFGIGAAARPLMRELLQLMTGGPGGLSGFLERFRSAGLGNEVNSYIGGRSEAALPAKTVDAALGPSTVAGIANRVGLAPAVAGAALGFEIPKVIGMLTPGGTVPASLPAEIQTFLRPSGEQVSPMAMATVRENEQVRPVAMTTVRPRTNIWPWALLALLILAGILWALLPRRAPVVPAPQPAVATPVTPAVPAPATPTATTTTLNHMLNPTVLNFPNGSAVLPAASLPVLQQAAVQIQNLPPGTVIQIGGHTDNRGDPQANIDLSERRAEAVRAELVRDGVPGSMLTAHGYGDAQPVASNDTPDGQAQNRRTEFTVVTNPPGATTTTTTAPAATQ